MRNIFLDTNFLIDYFIRDDFKSTSSVVFQKFSNKGDKFYISFLSVANFSYIMRKLPDENREIIIGKMCSIFEVVPNNGNQIMRALNLKPRDFEDALQYEAAMDAGCDCIITRNQKDFAFSKIPVMSAAEYLALYT